MMAHIQTVPNTGQGAAHRGCHESSPFSPRAASEMSCLVRTSVEAVGSRLWGTVSGTLALAKAEGQFWRRDQDGAEDGPVALGQDLGVLCHHFQHHVPHLLGDVTPEIQQGGDVLIAGQRARGESGHCRPMAPSTVLPQTSRDPEKLS